MLEEALQYERSGLSVIPIHYIKSNGECSCGSARCMSPGKHPRIAWRAYQTKRMSAEVIRAYWNDCPSCNVGIVTGPVSGILVLDIDGEEGMEALEKAGMSFDSLPITPAVRTGGGGVHLFTGIRRRTTSRR